MTDLGTQACYLICGTLKPGEQVRQLKPGHGHEEVLCSVAGKLLIHVPGGAFSLESGQAVRVLEDQPLEISNPGEEEVVYVMAGGPARPHH